MKRNIISSKVEPQNTEDLWLNLNDSKVYSFEGGVWTDINWIPNRVFNLQLDYNDYNLTHFLSPLFEEGFSDDDFPKKVYNKFKENNPEFKLGGEREVIRINCDLHFPPETIDNLSGYVDTPFTGTMKLVDGADGIDWPTSSSMCGTLYIYDLDIKINQDSTVGSKYATKISRISNDEDLWLSKDYYGSQYNRVIPKSILIKYDILDKKHDFKYTHWGGSPYLSKDSSGVYFLLKDEYVKYLASADIKLKGLENDLDYVVDASNNSIIPYSGILVEYISGIVSNKINRKKVNEILGEDVKYLIPAKIDLILPYDITKEELETLMPIGGISLVESSFIFIMSVAIRYIPEDQLDSFDPTWIFELYMNLHSTITLGLYQYNDDLTNKNSKINKLIETTCEIYNRDSLNNSTVNVSMQILETSSYKTKAYYEFLRKLGYNIIIEA